MNCARPQLSAPRCTDSSSSKLMVMILAIQNIKTEEQEFNNDMCVPHCLLFTIFVTLFLKLQLYVIVWTGIVRLFGEVAVLTRNLCLSSESAGHSWSLFGLRSELAGHWMVTVLTAFWIIRSFPILNQQAIHKFLLFWLYSESAGHSFMVTVLTAFWIIRSFTSCCSESSAHSRFSINRPSQVFVVLTVLWISSSFMMIVLTAFLINQQYAVNQQLIFDHRVLTVFWRWPIFCDQLENMIYNTYSFMEWCYCLGNIAVRMLWCWWVGGTAFSLQHWSVVNIPVLRQLALCVCHISSSTLFLHLFLSLLLSLCYPSLSTHPTPLSHWNTEWSLLSVQQFTFLFQQ